MANLCSHLEDVVDGRARPVTPSSQGCKECLQRGDVWVHLRLCLTCGHVGCCDSSPNKHASKHCLSTLHPVVKSFEPGEDWAWCFIDEIEVDAIPSFPGETPPVHYALVV